MLERLISVGAPRRCARNLAGSPAGNPYLRLPSRPRACLPHEGAARGDEGGENVGLICFPPSFTQVLSRQREIDRMPEKIICHLVEANCNSPIRLPTVCS